MKTNISFRSLKLFLMRRLGIPKHIAFIMDGNRRWSKDHHVARDEGHKTGYNTLMNMMEVCCDLGIRHMTVYAFSADNFQRSEDEVNALMDLALTAINKLVSEGEYIHRKHIRVTLFGDLDLAVQRSPNKSQCEKIRKDASVLMEKTKIYSDYFFNVCFSYSSKLEMFQGAECLSMAAGQNVIQPNEISLSHILYSLYSRDQPPVDLLIRTSGETRLSDFLLLQLRTAVIHFTPVKWPEFSDNDLACALGVWRKQRKDQEKIRKMIIEEEKKMNDMEEKEKNDSIKEIGNNNNNNNNNRSDNSNSLLSSKPSQISTHSSPNTIPLSSLNSSSDTQSNVQKNKEKTQNDSLNSLSKFCEEFDHQMCLWQSTKNTLVDKRMLAEAIANSS